MQPDEARKAAEALKQGDAAEAIRHQEQATNELNRLANELDRAVNLAKESGSQLTLMLSAVFFVLSMIFVWRSFYGMRIGSAKG